jgi:hypothetical protein
VGVNYERSRSDVLVRIETYPEDKLLTLHDITTHKTTSTHLPL